MFNINCYNPGFKSLHEYSIFGGTEWNLSLCRYSEEQSGMQIVVGDAVIIDLGEEPASSQLHLQPKPEKSIMGLGFPGAHSIVEFFFFHIPITNIFVASEPGLLVDL